MRARCGRGAVAAAGAGSAGCREASFRSPDLLLTTWRAL